MKSEYFHWLAVYYGTNDTDLFDYDRSMIKNLLIIKHWYNKSAPKSNTIPLT